MNDLRSPLVRASSFYVDGGFAYGFCVDGIAKMVSFALDRATLQNDFLARSPKRTFRDETLLILEVGCL